jgi:hypothetical protein
MIHSSKIPSESVLIIHVGKVIFQMTSGHHPYLIQ